MTALLDDVLAAHGGTERWSAVAGLMARATFGGPFWRLRGFPDLPEQTLHVDALAQRLDIGPFPLPGHRAELDATEAWAGRESLRIVGADGGSAHRDNPRATFPEFGLTTSWDAIQTAYFLTIASWGYFTEPFLFTWPGVTVTELDPWHEQGETWRRLAVDFPYDLPNHNPHQVFYYDADLRQRRMDYHPDVTGSPIAHYTHDPVQYGGLTFYAHRTVHRRLPDNTADFDLAVITIDTAHVAVHTKEIELCPAS